MEFLDLKDDELDDVVVGDEEVKRFEADARWLAIGKLNTSRPFSSSSMFETLKSVWGLAHVPKYREAGDNLFVFQMFCLGDWKKVVHGGPWLFKGMGLLVEDYDGKTDPTSISFDGLYVWAQIHKILDLYRHVEIVDQLAARIGRVKEVQLAPKLYYEGDYVRVRARVLVGKALTRFTPLTVKGERHLLPVRYEKIPYFCQVSGFMGHNHEECGDGVWEPKQKQFGSWMLAQRKEVPQMPQGGGRSTRGGRSRGRGRNGRGGDPVPRKRSSQDADLDGSEEEGDTETSPLKSVRDEVVRPAEEPTVRKNLNLVLSAEGTETSSKALVTMAPESTSDGKPASTPPLPPAYVSPREIKKAKKGSSPTKNNLALMAGSESEHRQAQ